MSTSSGLDQKLMGMERSAEDRLEVTLLLRDVSNDFWNSVIGGSAEKMMRRFPNPGKHGREQSLIASMISTDVDRQVLVDAIGGDFTLRLAREVELAASMTLDMRYSRMEIAGPHATRFLSFTIRAGDADAIYGWNVERAGLPSGAVPTAASLTRWDWGQWLDAILRTADRARRQTSSVYWRILHEMWRDGFIMKAMILALKHPKRLREEFGLVDCTVH